MQLLSLIVLALATPIQAAAYSKAKTALAKLINPDKVALATGTGWQKGLCVGNTAAIYSISWPAFCLQDAPLG